MSATKTTVPVSIRYTSALTFILNISEEFATSDRSRCDATDKQRLKGSFSYQASERQHSGIFLGGLKSPENTSTRERQMTYVDGPVAVRINQRRKRFRGNQKHSGSLSDERRTSNYTHFLLHCYHSGAKSPHFVLPRHSRASAIGQ